MTQTWLGRAAVAALMIATASAAQASSFAPAPSSTGSGGSSTPPVPYTSGQFYPFGGAFGGTFTFGANRIYCNPGTVRLPVQPLLVATKITTPQSAGNLSMALYADVVTGSAGSLKHRPSLLLASTGNVVTTNSTTISNPTAGQGALSGQALASALAPGTIYWKCMQADNAVVATLANTPVNVMSTIGDNTMVNAPASSSVGITGVYGTNTFGTWPADLTSMSWTESTNGLPDFYLQAP